MPDNPFLTLNKYFALLLNSYIIERDIRSKLILQAVDFNELTIYR